MTFNRKRTKGRTRFPRWFCVALAFVIIYCTTVAWELKYLPDSNDSAWNHFEALLSESIRHDTTAPTSLFRPAVPKRITAYLEPKMDVKIPGSASRGDPDKQHDKGVPPEYKEPLPLRLFGPQDLRKVEYGTISSCRDVPSKLPVGRPLTSGNVWNIGDAPLPENYTEIELPYCPVDMDPYLPWIHDLFLDLDGEQVQFVAQNRRRCRTGRGYGQVLESMEPQVALLQHVSVEIITEAQARTLAPGVWQSKAKEAPRYRLSDMSSASSTGKYTRFICKFHTTSSDGNRIDLGETLSLYPFNYELASYRKALHDSGMLSSKGKDNSKFWTATLLFSCPLPATTKTVVKTMVLNNTDERPLFHVDVIPIRTPPRFLKTTQNNGGFYLPKELVGPKHIGTFDPHTSWGENHVLPPVEASGRWENLPVCPVKSSVQETAPPRKPKPHLLSACLWASAIYHTRGKDRESLSDTKDRLMEWIEFHLMVGFDHIYVYDNSANDANNLKDITDMFSSKEVTWIDWPHVVCNNNIPAHDNTGERSSQYAAENSCRTRYASLTEWIASFDTDEYLVPMGKHMSLRSVVEEATDTNILSFRSSRGKLRYESSEQQNAGREKLPNVTFLEAYNCDGSESPRPEWADRARKQLYRTDYVPLHFVHYSTITRGLLDIPQGGKDSNWIRFYDEVPPSERVPDELNEATMIHAKTITLGHTAGWKNRCRYDFKKKWLGCYVGLGWPNNTKSETDTYDQVTELDYNCFVNPNVENYWIPKLNEALKARKR